MFVYKAKRIAFLLDDLLADMTKEGMPTDFRFEVAGWEQTLLKRVAALEKKGEDG